MQVAFLLANARVSKTAASKARCRPGRIRSSSLVLACLAAAMTCPPGSAAGPDPDQRRERMWGCGKAQAMARRYLADKSLPAWRDQYTVYLEAGLREASEDTDLLHCDVAIEIFPSSGNLAGVNTMTIQSEADGLTQFTFRLRDQFLISSIVVNGTTPVSVQTLSTTTRVVTLDRAYDEGEVFTLTVTYSGTPTSRGFGSIEFTSHFGQDIVYTLSEPFYAYTWWPIKDGDTRSPGDNGDKFTLEMAVTAPGGMVSASNGLLNGVDSLSGGRKRHRWSSDYPISPYLVCFSSSNYTTWQQTYVPMAGGAMPVLFYIYPEDDTSGNRAAWNKVVDMLYTFRDLFGEYPFVEEKYGIYECNFGGGMEHQTFTAQGTFSESVTVHELGHSWWGNMVTCKTWNHIWLNEGFATYSEALWEEFKPGSSGLPALKAAMADNRYTGGGSVYVADSDLDDISSIFSGSTSYRKGACVVHMLRHVLGDEDFFAALAAYRSAFEYSAATTEDLQAVCEGVYGASLEWFFQEWVYGEYAPSYRYGWSTTRVHGKDYLLLYLNQVQDDSIQRFSMPIDVVVNGARYTIFNDHDPEHFVIPIPAAASSVQLDPDEWVLWETRSTTSYVAGPPKIVETSPPPGATISEDAGTGQLSVTFHTNVSTVAADYTLVGAAGGPQGLSFAYDGGSFTTTLTAGTALPPDEYTLTVNDAVTATGSGHALDGEMADPADPGSLPSGEGVAGGDATIRFTIAGAVPGDLDGDGDVDLDDYGQFASCLSGPGGGVPEGCDDADLDADNDVDLLDFEQLALAFNN